MGNIVRYVWYLGHVNRSCQSRVNILLSRSTVKMSRLNEPSLNWKNRFICLFVYLFIYLFIYYFLSFSPLQNYKRTKTNCWTNYDYCILKKKQEISRIYKEERTWIMNYCDRFSIWIGRETSSGWTLVGLRVGETFKFRFSSRGRMDINCDVSKAYVPPELRITAAEFRWLKTTSTIMPDPALVNTLLSFS